MGSRVLVGLLLVCSACAFTQEERDRWRVEYEPRIRSEAMGGDAEWFVRNERRGSINAWRWPAPPGEDLLYVYQRHPTCDLSWEPTWVIIGDEGRSAYFSPETRGARLAPRPGRLSVAYDDIGGHIDLEKRAGEAILILIEPWNARRVDYWPRRELFSDDEELRPLETQLYQPDRNRERLAERCRLRNPIGTPLADVPRKLLIRYEIEGR